MQDHVEEIDLGNEYESQGTGGIPQRQNQLVMQGLVNNNADRRNNLAS